ncbi:MAG: DNA/RNA nuclease SfsA [Spirochaetaceae bacterium]|nr:DNA/RNA nuclease SfsA [Spirochaetaceae bacterium]
MKYDSVVTATFISRPNRFIAQVQVEENQNDKIEIVHVKNTGRCKELLIPGCKVYLEKSNNPNRKTKFDLIAVEKIYPENPEKKLLVNMDSQLPNKVAHEWLQTQGYSFIKPEFTFGKSRIDFYMEKDDKKFLMEVKGCTLEIDRIGYFPDAPTERGVKHLEELILASQQGYNCKIAFVIQMEGIKQVRGNSVTHPEFAKTLEKAKDAGVEVLFLCCRVIPDEVFVEKAIIG